MGEHICTATTLSQRRSEFSHIKISIRGAEVAECADWKMGHASSGQQWQVAEEVLSAAVGHCIIKQNKNLCVIADIIAAIIHA